MEELFKCLLLSFLVYNTNTEKYTRFTHIERSTYAFPSFDLWFFDFYAMRKMKQAFYNVYIDGSSVRNKNIKQQLRY